MLVLRRSLPLRVLCLLLIAAILCCSILMPMAEAFVFAGAAAYGAVELIAAILIGCGIIATTSDDARSMARQVYDWLLSHASAALDKINTLVGMAVGVNIMAGVRVSGELVDAIKQAVNSLTSTDASGNKFIGSTSDIVLPDGFPSLDVIINQAVPFWRSVGSIGERFNLSSHPVTAVFIERRVNTGEKYCLWLAVTPVNEIYAVKNISGGYNVKFHYFAWITERTQPNDYSFVYNGRYFNFTNYESDYQIENNNPSSHFQISQLFYSSMDEIYTESGELKYSSGSSGTVSIPYEGDIAYPSDDYLVRVPDLPDVQTDEEGKEVVVYPDLSLNPADHLADIPKDAAGEVADVPYDTLVDVGTGEAVGEGEGAGTGEEVGEGEGEGVENPDIPATDTGTIQSILDKITNFFDSPSDFKLNFDGFKNLILPDRFPFCIPFDLIDSIRVFAADAADFQFTIDLDTSYFSVHHTVDLTPFAVPIAFFRYTCIAFWVWILITRTRDLMKW